jgi:uncharacterized protein (DUF1499 family)
MKFEILFMMIVMGAASVFSCSGKISSNLGVKDGKLASCPDKPNCVSSQAADPAHKIDPIVYKSGRVNAYSTLVDIITNMKRTKIVTKSDNYIHAEFTSAIFRFVDDVEFYFDGTKNIIHVRSASRVGHSDMGVNRKRIEQMRKLFAEKDGNNR